MTDSVAALQRTHSPLGSIVRGMQLQCGAAVAGISLKVQCTQDLAD